MALSNLMVMPRDAPLRLLLILEQFKAAWEGVPMHAPPASQARGGELKRQRDVLSDALGCRFSMEPGDAVFYMSDVLHRTQDRKLDRTAVLFNLR